MQRHMLKSKIHRATITGLDINYEGSITIDEELMKQADMLPGEQVQVLNLSNGARFLTYTITAPAGSGTILLNGPAARLAVAGDKVIILTYCNVDDQEAQSWEPTIVLVDGNNKMVEGK